MNIYRNFRKNIGVHFFSPKPLSILQIKNDIESRKVTPTFGFSQKSNDFSVKERDAISIGKHTGASLAVHSASSPRAVLYRRNLHLD